MLGELGAAGRAQAGSRPGAWRVASSLCLPPEMGAAWSSRPHRLRGGGPSTGVGSGKHSEASVSPSARTGGGTRGASPGRGYRGSRAVRVRAGPCRRPGTEQEAEVLGTEAPGPASSTPCLARATGTRALWPIASCSRLRTWFPASRLQRGPQHSSDWLPLAAMGRMQGTTVQAQGTARGEALRQD